MRSAGNIWETQTATDLGFWNSGHITAERYSAVCTSARPNIDASRSGTRIGLYSFSSSNSKTPMAAFQTLLGLGTACNPTPYHRIRGAGDLSANGTQSLWRLNSASPLRLCTTEFVKSNETLDFQEFLDIDSLVGH